MAGLQHFLKKKTSCHELTWKAEYMAAAGRGIGRPDEEIAAEEKLVCMPLALGCCPWNDADTAPVQAGVGTVKTGSVHFCECCPHTEIRVRCKTLRLACLVRVLFNGAQDWLYRKSECTRNSKKKELTLQRECMSCCHRQWWAQRGQVHMAQRLTQPHVRHVPPWCALPATRANAVLAACPRTVTPLKARWPCTVAPVPFPICFVTGLNLAEALASETDPR